jgi:hypothetical protein
VNKPYFSGLSGPDDDYSSFKIHILPCEAQGFSSPKARKSQEDQQIPIERMDVLKNFYEFFRG